VAVGPDAEEDEIEARRQVDVCGAQRMNLRLGHVDAVQEGLPRELLVREVVVRRDVALVAPPDMPVLPVEGLRREPLVGGADRRASGERDSKRPARGKPGDPAGGVLG
jgi:hypothetical protein